MACVLHFFSICISAILKKTYFSFPFQIFLVIFKWSLILPQDGKLLSDLFIYLFILHNVDIFLIISSISFPLKVSELTVHFIA